MSDNVNDLQKVLLLEVTKGLLKRIQDGEATGAEFSAAINLLKNNNVTTNIETDTNMSELEQRINEIKNKRKAKITPEEKDFVLLTMPRNEERHNG